MGRMRIGFIGVAIAVTIDRGWHVNSDQPGDEFSMPTSVKWRLPEGWPDPVVQYPEGELLSFEFSESPIESRRWASSLARSFNFTIAFR